MYLEYFYILIVAFVFLLLTEIIGRVVMNLVFGFYKSGLSGLFLNMTFGFTAILAVYSVIVTHGRTINLGIFIVFSYIFFSNKNKIEKKKWNFDNNYREIFKPFLILFSVLAIVSLHYLPIISIDNDIRFYAKVAESLSKYGVENAYHHYNIYEQFSASTTPNHYFEFWIGSLFFNLIPWQESLIVFKYAVYFVLRFWALLGMLAIVEFFVKKINFIHVFYVISFSLITWNLPLGILNNGGWEASMYSSMWLRPNFIIYYAYILSTLLLFLYKENVTGLRLLLVLPVVSIVTAPAVLSSVFLFCLYAWLILREKKYSRLLLEAVSIGVFIIAFYLLTTNGDSAIPISEETGLISKTISLIKPIVGYIFKLTIRSVLFIVILLGLAIKVWHKEKALQSFLLLSFLLVFTGVVLFQIIAYVDNAYQFAYVGYVSNAIFAFVVSVYIIFNRVKLVSILLPVCLAFILIWSVYDNKKQFNLDITQTYIAKRDLQHYGFSEKYIDGLKEFFEEGKINQGAFAVSSNALGKYNPKRRHTLTYQIDSHIAYFLSNQTSYSIIRPEIMYMEESESSRNIFIKAHSFNDKLPFYMNYDNQDGYILNYMTSKRVSFIISDLDYKLPNGVLSKEEFVDIKQGLIFREIEYKNRSGK